MATKIKYKNQTLAQIQNGQTIELETAGHKFTDNLFVQSYGQGDSTDATLIEKTITANGTYPASADNADGYSSVKVNVPIPDGYKKPTGTINITENGLVYVSNYEYANVSVESGASATLIEKTITENGVYEADADNADGFSRVEVAVPMGGDGKPIVIETEEELNALLETVTDDDVGKIYSLMPAETAELGIPPIYFVLTKENE